MVNIWLKYYLLQETFAVGVNTLPRQWYLPVLKNIQMMILDIHLHTNIYKWEEELVEEV